MRRFEVSTKKMDIDLVAQLNEIVDGLEDMERWIVVDDDIYAALRRCLEWDADEGRYLRFKNRNVIPRKWTCEVEGRK